MSIMASVLEHEGTRKARRARRIETRLHRFLAALGRALLGLRRIVQANAGAIPHTCPWRHNAEGT